MHCTSRTLLSGIFAHPATRSAALPPPFLVPILAAQQTSSFSTTAQSFQRNRPTRIRKDGNPLRGQSALHRSGLKKEKLSVDIRNIPQPVIDPRQRSQIETDPDHGLWDFFPEDRSPMITPTDLVAHGRAWTVAELRTKDWDDLHRLWWVCLKEINRIKTTNLERDRRGNMYGGHEAKLRIHEVRDTMKAIKHTLTERWYAWDNARTAAMQDSEINMYADLDNGEKPYLPSEAQDASSGVESAGQAALPHLADELHGSAQQQETRR